MVDRNEGQDTGNEKQGKGAKSQTWVGAVGADGPW